MLLRGAPVPLDRDQGLGGIAQQSSFWALHPSVSVAAVSNHRKDPATPRLRGLRRGKQQNNYYYYYCYYYHYYCHYYYYCYYYYYLGCSRELLVDLGTPAPWRQKPARADPAEVSPRAESQQAEHRRLGFLGDSPRTWEFHPSELRIRTLKKEEAWIMHNT